jgi:hypothetical protein
VQQNRNEASLIKNIELGSAPRKIAWPRVADYVLVFGVGGQAVFNLLLAIGSGGTLQEHLLIVGFFVVCSLCFFVGYRNLGVLDPDNWVDHVIVLSVGFVLFAFAAWGMLATAQDAGQALVKASSILLAGACFFGVVIAAQLLVARFPPAGKARGLIRANNARGEPLGAKLNIPSIDRRRGIALGAGGFLVLLASLLLGSPLLGYPDRLIGPVSNVVWLVNMFAFGLLVRSRRYFQMSADALLDVDRRAPILFLRSFEHDERVKFGSEQQHLLDFSIETRLANHLMRFGPFIALRCTPEAAPSRVARATAAAQEFLALAGKSPAPPRMSDPSVHALLAAAFDTSALRNDSGPQPALRDVAQWFDVIEAVYSYHLLFGTGYSDLGAAIDATSQNAEVEKKLAANAVTYAPEFGLGLDAEMAVLGRFSELLLPLGEKGRGRQAIMRNLLIGIWAVFVPAVDDDWRRARLQAVIAAAHSAGKSLVDEQRTFLRNFARQGADAVANPEIRTRLLELSTIFGGTQ